MKNLLPTRIICLTEETTEWLYLLGQEARIVGICRTERHFFGYPYVFCTYDQAIAFSPKQRKMLSMILAEPAEGWEVAQTARAIERETGARLIATHELDFETAVPKPPASVTAPEARSAKT